MAAVLLVGAGGGGRGSWRMGAVLSGGSGGGGGGRGGEVSLSALAALGAGHARPVPGARTALLGSLLACLGAPVTGVFGGLVLGDVAVVSVGSGWGGGRGGVAAPPARSQNGGACSASAA